MDKIESAVLEYVQGAISEFDAVSEIRNSADKIKTKFTENEIVWLQYNVSFIPKILENKSCSHIFAHLHSAKYGYARQLMRVLQNRKIIRYTPDNTRGVFRWLKILEKTGLIVSHREQYGNRVLYFANKKVFPNLTQMIFDLITKKHFGYSE